MAIDFPDQPGIHPSSSPGPDDKKGMKKISPNLTDRINLLTNQLQKAKANEAARPPTPVSPKRLKEASKLNKLTQKLSRNVDNLMTGIKQIKNPVKKQTPLSESKSNPMTQLFVRAHSDKIQPADTAKIDVSGLDFRSRLAVKASRSLSFTRLLEGAVNANTILKGSLTSWDPVRLKKGKHELLRQAGAEHIQLKSTTGCKVDAHFLDAATFVRQLEDMGGERKVFQVDSPPLLNGNEYICHIKGDFPVTLQEIHLNPDQQKILEREKVQHELSLSLGYKVTILKDPEGKFFLADPHAMRALDKAKLIYGGNNLHGDYELEKGEIPQSNPTTFSGIKFPKTNPQYKDAVKLLTSLKVDDSSWKLVDTLSAAYLVPAEHKEKIELGVRKSALAPVTETHSDQPLDSNERGTVLLTMNQTNIYEQYTDEMLTFALQGVNVMMYNNPGKGLSTGGADRKNIDASIEAAYKFLKQEKGIPDEKILAKGQCFGGAPTAWLGKEHPNINLMLDQNPANFNDVVVSIHNQLVDKLPGEESNRFSSWLKKTLKNNFLITGIAKVALGNYDIPADLSQNKGHKLLNINVANPEGIGGDELVPAHHPELMLDAIETNQDKEISLSMNPGGSHVTHWWTSPESKNSVNSFLDKTGISQPLL